MSSAGWRDPDHAQAIARAVNGGGGRCLQPIMVRTNGNEWAPRSCRRCVNCIKGRKSDHVGRMLLEAEGAGSTFMATLTYGPDHPGAAAFSLDDVQKFMKRLRWEYAEWAWRVHGVKGARVRFKRTGEKGSKGTRRWHHHLMLFFSGPRPEIERNKHTHRGQLWNLWPHGWSEVKFVPKDQASQHCNYVAKYLVKDAFSGKAVSGGSSRPALGAPGLCDIARRTARAGLPLREEYTVANVIMTRGPLKGRLRKFRMQGRAMDHAFRAYRDEREATHGEGCHIPLTEWGLRNDPDAVFVAPGGSKPLVWRKRPKARRQIARGRKAGWMAIRNLQGQVVGMLECRRSGTATFAFTLRSDRVHFVRDDLRGILDMPPADHDKVAAWLREHRGPQWVSYADHVAERKAAIAAHVEALRAAECGGKAAIHDGAYFKGRDVLETMRFGLAALEHKLRSLGFEPEPDAAPP